MAQEATTKTITFDEVEYEIAQHPLEDLDALEAYEDGKYATLARLVLGNKQYATFKKKKRTSSDVLQLVASILGVDLEDDN